MMFNNIIYFIIALLIFSVNDSGKPTSDSLISSIAVLLGAWLVFSFCCFLEFRRIKWKNERASILSEGLSSHYNKAVVKLSVLALCLFALSVHYFGLKWWLSQIPIFLKFSVLQGAAAISLFIFYLITIWYFAYPVYILIFRQKLKRKIYILSNVRLNLPIVFPWFFISLLYDLVESFPILSAGGFLNSAGGQFVFLSVSLGLLVIFFPVLLQYFWKCKPLATSEKVSQLKSFFEEKGFKYGNFVNWPIFEGQMMTAGIMGVIPRYRYLLITDSLLNALSLDELKAVMAHEMGHARYRHLLFYVVFLAVFMAVLIGLPDISRYFIFSFPSLAKVILESGDIGVTFLNLAWFMPVILIVLIYFRYIMGFFMRNFERQADLYSAKIIGTPVYTISSLEKIAAMSGKIRDLPSWHHFSISERVEHLWRAIREPDLLKRQNRLLIISFLIYFVSMGSLGYVLNFGQIKEKSISLITENIEDRIKRRILEEPNNVALLNGLAMIYHEKGAYNEAIRLYERILGLEPDNPEVLNNLGYLYAEQGINLDEAMSLVQKALKLKSDSGYIIDSLGWIYFKKGSYDDALYNLERAVNLSPDNPTINEHLGDVFFAKKSFQRAIELYRKALYLGHPEKDRLKRKIENTEKIINN